MHVAASILRTTKFSQNPNMRMLNSIMEDVSIMAVVFRLIFRERPIITNVVQINEMQLLNSIMGLVWTMPAVLRLVFGEPPIISNLLQINEMRMLNTNTAFLCPKAMACGEIWHNPRIF
jgi:hypothetical protein